MLNFLGIGAQKCATTWLHDTLARHPDIAFPAGKEVHYWNRPDDRSINWYAQLFANSSKVNGEITPAYALLPLTTIQQIHASFPDLRLIYLIRNPAERAWSSARMALGRAEMLHSDASDQWFIDHFKSQGSLARGDYEACIARWRSVFPSNRIHIVKYESIQADPVGVANRCLAHLSLQAFFSPEDSVQLKTHVLRGDGFELRPSLRSTLSSIYTRQIESLALYLGEDLSDWRI
jgi:Sulfotransferase family